MAEKPSNEAPPQVLEYLRSQNTLTLATATTSGLPHAATMVYVGEGITLYFCTRPDTTTARNIAENPSVAFTIDEYSPDWSKTKGIQGTGECQVLLNSADIKRVVGLFRQRFSFLSEASTANVSCYRIVPVELKFIDNEAAGAGRPQSLAMEYRRSLVYSVFKGLPRHEVETLAARLETVHVEAGGTIVRQGAPADKFFIIVDGEVDVLREESPGQAAKKVASLKPGQFFGEMALLTGEKRAATVVAATDVDLFTLDKTGFHDVMVGNPAIAVDISTILSERRAALEQAEGDLTARFQPTASRGELKERILDRIRGYFGL
jgi:CRP-like cAMP-binding protein